METSKITTFDGKYSFLSNFYESQVHYEGITYPTVEHAYQAQKTNNQAIKIAIAGKATPGQAKRAGGAKGIIKDIDFEAWESRKHQVMEQLVRIKFQQPDLAEKLVATGTAQLEEGNLWNDTYWGVNLHTGQGQNKLGYILMAVRDDLIKLIPTIKM